MTIEELSAGYFEAFIKSGGRDIKSFGIARGLKRLAKNAYEIELEETNELTQ